MSRPKKHIAAPASPEQILRSLHLSRADRDKIADVVERVRARPAPRAKAYRAAGRSTAKPATASAVRQTKSGARASKR